MTKMRFALKGFALTLFSFFNKLLILSLSVGMAAFLAAMSLDGVKEAQVYPGVETLLSLQKSAQAPFVTGVRDNLPHIIGGVDFAPWFYLAALLSLWVLVLTQNSRINGFRWALAQEKKQLARDLELRAEREASRMEKKEALARMEHEAKERADRESLERARRQAELDAQHKSVESLKMRESQRLIDEARHAAEASLREDEEDRLAAARAALTAATMNGGSSKESTRDELLELMARAKKQLEKQKKSLSFLSIDIVDSTGMKIGEDPAIATRDFKHYRKLVEKAISDNNGLKAAWTPDGVMICFPTAAAAVGAAKQVIGDLKDFNARIKAMSRDFKVRCGINTGTVLFDDTVPMEEMSDRSIDIAGHMQKYAEANTIYIGKHVIEEMLVSADFQPASKQVDGCEVYSWNASPN